MTDLSELLERCRKAAGPDRELDCQIAYHLDFQVEGMAASFRKYCDVHDLKWGEIARHANSYQSILYHSLPRFTASVDAALALVERCLPGWKYHLWAGGVFGDKLPTAHLMEADFAQKSRREEPHQRSQGSGATAPLAILSALLQAIGEQP